MYIAIKNKNIIAAHDEEEVILSYINSQPDPSKIQALRVKKKKSKKLMELPDFHDVYLVRYGSYYIPYKHYRALKESGGYQRDEDLRFCKDILYRLLEEGVLGSKKDILAIKRSISIVMSEIESLDDPDYETLERITNEMNELRSVKYE